MILWFVIALASSLFFYLEALKEGMWAPRWAVKGMLMGPLLWPLFWSERSLHRRRHCLEATIWQS